MFQDFSAQADPVTGDHRLNELRKLMLENGFDATIVPHTDEQNNEYLPPEKERLAWLTGFTGSAGMAIVTSDRAVLFVDGRYTLQAADQVDTDHWELESIIDYTPARWLKENLSNRQILAIDPWLHVSNQIKAIKTALESTESRLKYWSTNPIDHCWHNRPPASKRKAKIHDFEFAGRLTSEKLTDVKATMEKRDADLCILTDPSSVCWLFNIRGADLAHTPVVLSHAIIQRDGDPVIFIDEDKLDIETRAFLTQVATIEDTGKLSGRLEEMSAGKRVMVDPDRSPIAFSDLVKAAGGKSVRAADPIAILRATKNKVEIKGAKAAQLRDGAAVTTFLAWLDDQPAGTIDEITAAQKLETLRADMAGDMPLREISFDTISGSGPHGAIVHYRVDTSSNRTLQDGELFLCDSGAQYDDGTTDIPRTIAIGEPSEEQRRAFTLVLKGHIGIALARFPKGTRGMDLDPFARMPLWQHGMDYAHGTGHGVGSYLSVHEGPQNLSKRGHEELLPGMILSNEPGYYREGEFGIRIENLILVREAMDIDGGDQPMLGFETLTLAPLDRRLIDPTMMTDDELHWLNAYHGWVHRSLNEMVPEGVQRWLKWATEPMLKNLPPASA